MLHPDAAAIDLAIAWLEATEGILWTRIRGAGLAYGAFMGLYPRRGEIIFDTYRSPNAYLAWKEARNIVHEILAGKVNAL
jgi:Zn-dependent M16 (insulinase) family peptidase